MTSPATPLGTETARAAEAAPSASAEPTPAPRPAVGRVLATGLSGLLALLFLVCALLPLLQGAGEVPRGFERHAALTSAAVPAAPDLLAPVSVALLDLDDQIGGVVQARAGLTGPRDPSRVARPPVAIGLDTRAVAPLERPPRLPTRA